MAWRVTARRPRRMSAGQYAAWGSGRIQRLAAHRASFISGAVLWSRAVGSRRPYGCTHAAFCTPRLACPIIAYLPVCVPRRCVLHTNRRRRNLESMVRRAACAADRVAPVPASGTPRYSRLYCLPPTSALSRPAGFGRSGYCGSVGFEHSRQFRSTKSQPAPLHTHPPTRPPARARARMPSARERTRMRQRDGLRRVRGSLLPASGCGLWAVLVSTRFGPHCAYVPIDRPVVCAAGVRGAQRVLTRSSL